MERHELNRMFDRLAPTPEQEQEGLRRLLQTERKVRPMKKLKKMTVLGIAAALIIAAMGAGLAWRQVSVHFIGTEEELEEVGVAYGESMSRRVYSDDDGRPDGYDWVIDHGKMSYDLALEITEGSPEDSWTRHRMRVMDGQYAGYCGIDIRDDIYRGDSLAKLGELWDVGWDLAWVDAHYETSPSALAQFRTHVDREAPCYISFSGGYQGEDGQNFGLNYERHTEADVKDDVIYVYTDDYTEQYVTRDGVSVSIMMGDNEVEVPMFEAMVQYNLAPNGYVRFTLTGINMGLDEIHTLLDSLHLSNLTK